MIDKETSTGERPTVIVDVDEGVGWITLNNPSRRNAMSLNMWHELGDAVITLTENPDVRLVVMRGAGDKAFVSGDDVTEFPKLRSTPLQQQQYAACVTRAYQQLASLDKPLLAVVEGACIGAGLVIALYADIRIAVQGARFGIPAARIGVGAAYEGVALLARLVGPSTAKDIFFTGRHITCDEALRIGLINECISAQEAESFIEDYISRIRSNAPLTLRCVKHATRLFEQYSENDMANEITILSQACYDSADYREGIRAFAEKRAPVFRGV